MSSRKTSLTLGALALALIFVAGFALAPAAYAHHKEGHTANCANFPESPFCQVDDEPEVPPEEENNNNDDEESEENNNDNEPENNPEPEENDPEPIVNQPPGDFYPTLQAFDQQVTTNATTPATIQLEGDSLTIDFQYFIMQEPVNGTITDFDANTGTLTYTPFEGAESDTFTFTIYGECDSFLACLLIGHLGDTLHGNEATVSITINQPEQPEQHTGGSINLAVVYQYAEKIAALNGTIPSDNLSGYDLGNGAVVMDYQTFADLQPYISPTLAWAFDIAGIDFNALSDGQKAWLYLYVTVLP